MLEIDPDGTFNKSTSFDDKEMVTDWVIEPEAAVIESLSTYSDPPDLVRLVVIVTVFNTRLPPIVSNRRKDRAWLPVGVNE